MRGDLVIGAILGDILGSPYERIPQGLCNPDIDLSEGREFTDDSILTVATMECMLDDSEEFERYYMRWASKFINKSVWGKNFATWVKNGDCKKIEHSWGNGCLMRISPIAYYPGTEEECKRLAILSCQYTHNCPESFLAAIKYIEVLYRYLHHMPVVNLTNNYQLYLNNPTGFDCSVASVDQAYSAFLEISNLEGAMVGDCINAAIRLGGDTDTIGAMTGALAETILPSSEDFQDVVEEFLPEDMFDIVVRFSERFNDYKCV